MEEELCLPQNSARCNLSAEDEKEKVVDFVYKHFRGMTDGSLFSSVEESPLKDHGGPTRRDSPNKAHCKVQQGAVFSGKILSFECSVCKDGSTYSPNDLLKHFRAAHKGTLPTYPCDLCGFFTNEFPALQRHRIEHRNTQVTCELCNDDVQYSLLLLTRHYIMCHSLNGQFHCDWCQFTTMDAGTFVQHIHHHNESHWKCTKCRHISLSEEDHQRHMKAHFGTFPFTCQICGYGAVRSEYLKKHTAAVHKEEADRRNTWKSVEDTISPANSSACFKLLLKKSESQENHRVSKLNCPPGTVSNHNGHVIKPEISLEETHHFVDGLGAKKDKTWRRGPHNTEHSDCENSAGSDSAAHSSPNGLTVLMVKNKISLPPNCTTKVMGFKMVEGKKHLVLKVIPTSKQDLSIQSCLNPVLDKSRVNVENGEGSHCKSSNPCCYSVSPKSRSCSQLDQDEIMTVKVKIEEEETSVCSLDNTPHRDNVRGQTDPSLNSLSACADTFYPMTNEFDLCLTTCSERSLSDCSSVADTVCNNLGACAGEVTCLSTPLKVSQRTFLSKRPAEDCGAAKESTQFTAADQQRLKSSNTTEKEDQSHHSSPKKHNPEIQNKNGKKNAKKLSTDPLPQFDSSLLSSGHRRESDLSSENCTKHSSSNQEVFSFHNYSKESFSSYFTQISDSLSKQPPDKHCVSELSQFSLSLAESPELTRSTREVSRLEKNQGDVKKLADSYSEANECTVDDPPSGDENPESVLQDFNIIKIEEETVPVCRNQPETKSSSNSSGSLVENHSHAILTQQPNKERVVSANTAQDSLKQTKTTLRILQLPEGKQPVLLRTTENRYAMPVQVKASPGFKLITNSTNPQINVSFMTPGSERSLNPAGLTLSPNNRRTSLSVSKATTSEKGTTLFSAVQPGFSNASNHYFLNSPGFKGPVLLSSTPHNTCTDTTNKTQPTCYLVQRSVPFSQTPSTPGLRLASTQVPLNSQPVLAMPMNSLDKPSTPQASRQAFLLRYIAPPKSSLHLNSQEGKAGAAYIHTNESVGNKVIFKIVTPTGSLLTSGAPTPSSQPLFLATRPQSQCFLVSSNKTNGNTPTTVRKLITLQNSSQRELKDSCISPIQVNNEVPQCEIEKPILAPRPIRPPSQRKRRRKALFDELPETMYKARRLAHKAVTDKETAVLWRPLSKDFERTLRLAPFSSLQLVKCPRRYQPVVVLNHPDAEIPEITRIMKVVDRHKGAVTKVSLSQKTVQALSELGPGEGKTSIKFGSSHCYDPTSQLVRSSVRERFVLKMKLRKKSRKKYEVVDPASGCHQEAVVFTCWFCGRLFNCQEDWVGHGQRHLMEATRDWNKLF